MSATLINLIIQLIAGAVGGLVWIFSAEKAAKDTESIEAQE